MSILNHKKTERTVLISGAGFAGLSTAYWMNKFGYKVTVVEVAKGLKMGGTPVNIEGETVETVKLMGIFEQIKANRLVMEMLEFKNAEDFTEGSAILKKDNGVSSDDECEIERNTLLNLLFDTVKNEVKFIFNNSITALTETTDHMEVTFLDGSKQNFDLVFGCDGIHSAVRRLWFGHENEYLHFLGQYFSITIVDKLLIRENTSQFYNVPDKVVMLNAYNNKTDIIFCFRSEIEIPYDYRNEAEQRKIILEQFAGESWRTDELLQEIQQSETFYFDKLCQVRMPSWTKGRVALVGDAGYCASPAAGKGGSLAIDGASALANAFERNDGNFELAFQDYNNSFRPFIEEIQAQVVAIGLDVLIPRTEEAIRKRNKESLAF